MELPGKPTLHDVAREAGVSLATVDRVLNHRPGVRLPTAARVESAIERLGYQPDAVAARLARNERFRFCFLLPAGPNTFMRLLAEAVERTARWLAPQRAYIEMVRVDVFDPIALSDAIAALDRGYDGVALVALDHPRVRAAIDDLAAAGATVVTLVSDAPASRRTAYVGVDNAAAGRTAATLMGRFTGGRAGSVALIAGSLSLRDHAERHYGFGQVLGAEYKTLSLLSPRESRDDSDRTRTIVLELLDHAPDLVGIYNAGAGSRGVAAALAERGRARDVVFIGHDLTVHTRRFLLDGVMDAVINQDPGHEARSAARILLASRSGEPIVPEQERIRIDIFVRDNMP